MRFLPVYLGMMLSLLFPTAGPTPGKVDFNGLWLMDRSKAEGIPPNMDQKMRVRQDGDRLDLETDLIVNDDINTINDGYDLSGKEVEYPARLSDGQETRGKRVAKWSADGAGIEVNEEATFDTPDGKIRVTMRRRWTLSADGKTLLIEL